ncbi:MAG: ABC transporter permease subunit [Desulfobacterales bacterium]|nr:MAG: ABC transporter permease subunit [Desulfobacterales bacterium]
MSVPFNFPVHTVRALVKREFSAAIRGWGLYAAMTLAFLTSSFFLNQYMGAIGDNNIRIASDPLSFPLHISLFVVSFYLAIVAAVAISREKDQGTLEVLFYGPVNCSSYLTAKYLADMLVYLVLAGFMLLYFLAVSALTRLALSWNLMHGLVLSFFSVSCVISFSLLISAMTSKIRNSIMGLVASLIIFLGVQIVHGLLGRLGAETLSPSWAYFRNIVNPLYGGIEWISPFAPLNRGMEAVLIGNMPAYGATLLYCLFYALIFLAAAVMVLARKGVRG